jgi:hypothetical protein
VSGGRPWRVAAAGLALVFGARGGSAQVGYPPERSPYVDLEYRHELTTLTGYLNTQRDPAGVAPRSGPLAGIRYALHIAGPAFFTGRLAYARTERTVLDPLDTSTSRVVLPAASVPLLFTDVGLALSLTGFKSWHRLVPEIGAGLGLLSDFRTESDVGGFGIGTRFALTFGAGVRWVPGGRFQLRADVADNMYRIAYPESYYLAGSHKNAILPATQSRALWTHNPSFTLGVSYLFWR